MWSSQQREQWYLRLKEYEADISLRSIHAEQDTRRKIVQSELVAALTAFLDSTMSLEEFNRIFQQKTHGSSNVFGLGGTSGGMFLSKLMKYIVDKEQFTCRLRSALRVPQDVQRRMGIFMRFLDDLIVNEGHARIHLQPARVPFFLSACWHLQAPTRWPIFYPIVHTVLMNEANLSISEADPVEEYLRFRVLFTSLAKELNVSSWQLEHLCTWYGLHQLHAEGAEKKLSRAFKQRRNSRFEEPAQESGPMLTAIPVNGPDAEMRRENALLPKNERDTTTHTHLQWLLAKIGLKVGCDVWIAINDHSKVWNSERLGDLCKKPFPCLAGTAVQRIVSRIDVLWLQNNTVIAAYEVEHSTDIAMGLLRLYDLGALCSYPVPLCVVAPHWRFERIQFELSRPSFLWHGMRKQCGLIAEELLLAQEEHILRWAGSPSVINTLICPTGSKENQQEEGNNENGDGASSALPQPAARGA